MVTWAITVLLLIVLNAADLLRVFEASAEELGHSVGQMLVRSVIVFGVAGFVQGIWSAARRGRTSGGGFHRRLNWTAAIVGVVVLLLQ